MSDLVVGIFFLLVVLTVIAVAGHGLWLLAAWLLGAVRQAPEQAGPVVRCIYCKRLTSRIHRHCLFCGLELDTERLAELEDLEAAFRAVGQVRRAGLISSANCEELLERMSEYRQQLLEHNPAPPPVPEKSPVPPAPVSPILAAPPPVPPPAPVALATVPEPPAAKPEPRAPRRSLGEVLREFMEPHNIRWGELVGGLLLIVGAAALVITQWETLEQFRYFRAGAFALSTAAVFGVGLYAQHRWRLEATSRVLLTVAALLVPLNFLALAGLADTDPLTLALDGVSLAGFTALLALSGRVLVPGARWWQAGAIAAISAVILASARWFATPWPSWTVTLAGCLPAAILGVATGTYLARAGRRPITPTRAAAILTLTGTVAFAVVVSLGVLAYRGLTWGRAAAVLDGLSIPLSLAAAAVLTAGLAVGRGVPARKGLESLRAGGVWTALVAGAAMVAALGLAWPWPPLVATVGLFVCLTLGAAALKFDLPALHAGAIAAALGTYLAAVYWLSGASADLDRTQLGHDMLRQLVQARTGSFLVGLVVGLSGLAYLLSRWGRQAHGLAYAVGSAVVAALSLIWVTAGHSPEPERAMAVYLIYAAGSLALCAHFRRPILAYAGLGLLLAGLGWAMTWQTQRVDIAWAAAYAVLGLGLSVGATVLGRIERLTPFEPSTLFAPTSLGAAYRLPMAQAADFAAALGLVLGAAMAWIDQARIDHSLVPVVAIVALAAHWHLTAWTERMRARTVIGSLVVMAGLVHTLAFNYTGRLVSPWTTALLAHATLALLAAAAIRWFPARSRSVVRRWLRAVFVEPLANTAIISSSAALLLLPTIWHQPGAMSGYLFWLSATCLLMAVLRVWRAAMALHQVALAAAVGVGAYAWFDQLAPDSWAATHLLREQAIGIALAGLALVWVGLRIGLRGRLPTDRLLPPDRPMPDRLLKHALFAVQVPWALYALGTLSGHMVGAWTGWALLVAIALASLWERWTEADLADAVLLAVALPLVVAGPMASDDLALFAVRCGLAACYLAASLAMWARRPLGEALAGVKARVAIGPTGLGLAHGMTLALLAAPVIGLSTGNWTLSAPLEPVPAELIPLGLVLAALVGHAVRENQAAYLLGAGLVLEWMVFKGQMVHYGVRHTGLSEAELLGLVQWPALAAAMWAMAWLWARQTFGLWREEEDKRAAVPMTVQLALACFGSAVPLGLGLFGLLAGHLERVPFAAIGSALGWTALLVTAGAGLLRTLLAGRRPSLHFAAVVALAVVAMLACTIEGRHPDSAWSYRTLMLGCAALSLVVGQVSCLSAGFRPVDLRAWAALLAALAVAFAWRWSAIDPAQPWYPAGTVLAAALSLGLVAVGQQRPGFVWTSGLLVNLAAWMAWRVWGPDTTAGLVNVQVLALALSGTAWSLVRIATGRVPDLPVEPGRLAFSHAALSTAVALAGAMAGQSLVVQLAMPHDKLALAAFRLTDPVHAIALGATIAGLLVALADRSARFALAGLYAAGLAAIGLVLARQQFAWQPLWVHAAPALGAFTLVAAAISRPGRAIRGDRWSTAWFTPAQMVVGAVTAGLAVWLAVDFRFEPVAPGWLLGLDGRAAGPLAVALATVGLFALAVGQPSNSPWRDLTLAGAALLPATAAWAAMGPQIDAPWLHRFVILLAVAAAGVVTLQRRGRARLPAWRPAFDRAILGLALVAGAATVAVFALEWYHYDPAQEKMMGLAALSAVGLALAALAAACLGFAVGRHDDPLRLGPEGRTAYVYAAEVLVALIGIHLRLAWPELFRLGIIERYGMVIAMALAFALAGVAEIFRRRGTDVLCQPLERTALVLPGLPMIAFWFLDVRPAAVWFLIGLFYGTMAAMRRSFWLGVLAVLSANMGLWVLWHRMDLGLLAHPQLWLIPPALAALVAEYLSAGRLSREQSAAVRYLSLSVVYLSSSADMFIAGIGNSVLLPLVLLSLSVAGILAGMALRVQSFLYLGVTFVLVVVAALLEHVTIALGQTWVLWLSVVAMGALLLALFGVFEKRRNDVLAAMDRFKTWQR